MTVREPLILIIGLIFAALMLFTVLTATPDSTQPEQTTHEALP